MKTARLLPLLLALLLLAPRAGRAQEPAPIAEFVAAVAGLWAAGDAEGLVGLAPSGGRILLDLGGASAGEVQPRNAAAALRRLFADRETTSVRSARATISGGTPLRGFGELAWASRARGVRDSELATVYVGTVFERGSWRIRELRVLR
jgi:hypothetical protein